MSINMSLLFLAGLGAFAVGYGFMMDSKSSFDDGSFIFQIMLIAGGGLVIAAALIMKLIFSVS